MKRVIFVFATLMLLPGCLPSAGIARFHAAEAVVENEADSIFTFIVERLCGTKIDILARIAARNADAARAIYYGCPEVRSLVMTTLQAVGTGGLSVEFRIGEE